jgi:acyl dehydratase
VTIAAAPVEIAVGDELPPSVIGPITRIDIVRFAGASGDFNIVHLDDEFAQGAGYPTAFAMGMLPAGALITRLGRWLGPANIQRVSIRFTGLTWPGDTISFSGRVEAIDGSLAEVELAATRQTGEVVARAVASVTVLPSDRLS